MAQLAASVLRKYVLQHGEGEFPHRVVEAPRCLNTAPHIHTALRTLQKPEVSPKSLSLKKLVCDGGPTILPFTKSSHDFIFPASELISRRL